MRKVCIRMDIPITNNIGGAGMKRLTKVSIFFILYFILSTAYAFAALVGHQFRPLPAPINLLMLGITLLGAGHILKNLIDE